MLDLIPNHPLDLEELGRMLTDRDDLNLVWPDARYPFDPDQWRETLTAHPKTVSFFVEHGEERIGHAALVGTEKAGSFRVCFLYLAPALRGQGLGRQFMEALEIQAREVLNANELTLVVRTYNPRALRVYERAGFEETGRDGTLVQMRKSLDANSWGNPLVNRLIVGK